MEYSLGLVQVDTKGSDGQVNLSLKINCTTKPIYLSDFSGGSSELFDGYSGYTTQFGISNSPNDERRLLLTSKTDSVSSATLAPQFIRNDAPKDPFNQLEALPLKKGQILSLGFESEGYGREFEITYMS